MNKKQKDGNTGTGMLWEPHGRRRRRRRRRRQEIWLAM
jgi:hypothetical protein